MTKVYGCSDDLIEFEGEAFKGEVGCYSTDDREHGVLVFMSDGTIIEVKYGKGGNGIWEIILIKTGRLLDHIDLCHDSEAPIYSDVAYFRDGITGAYAATEWERVS